MLSPNTRSIRSRAARTLGSAFGAFVVAAPTGSARKSRALPVLPVVDTIKRVDADAAVTVDLASGKVSVETKADAKALGDAIEAAGYEVAA